MYGFSFEQMSKIRRPKIMKRKWGQEALICSLPQYDLRQFIVRKGASMPRHIAKFGGMLYLEEGRATLFIGGGRKICLAPRNTFELPPGTPFWLGGEKESALYLFSGNSASGRKKISLRTRASKTTDFREKYWGSIETVVSKEYCGKRIEMRKGTQNSLEFHCSKHETYYVHSGKVKVGLRLGRAENRSVVLSKGDVFHIPPGLMHMKIAMENCVVIEISTKDDDSDSHLVENGQTYVHNEVKK